MFPTQLMNNSPYILFCFFPFPFSSLKFSFLFWFGCKWTVKETESKRIWKRLSNLFLSWLGNQGFGLSIRLRFRNLGQIFLLSIAAYKGFLGFHTVFIANQDVWPQLLDGWKLIFWFMWKHGKKNAMGSYRKSGLVQSLTLESQELDQPLLLIKPATKFDVINFVMLFILW